MGENGISYCKKEFNKRFLIKKLGKFHKSIHLTIKNF